MDTLKKFLNIIEMRRKEVQQKRKERHEGTFKGLEDAIARKKKENEDASKNRQ